MVPTLSIFLNIRGIGLYLGTPDCGAGALQGLEVRQWGPVALERPAEGAAVLAAALDSHVLALLWSEGTLQCLRVALGPAKQATLRQQVGICLLSMHVSHMAGCVKATTSIYLLMFTSSLTDLTTLALAVLYCWSRWLHAAHKDCQASLLRSRAGVAAPGRRRAAQRAIARPANAAAASERVQRARAQAQGQGPHAARGGRPGG